MQTKSKELRGTILLMIVHKSPELKVQVRAGDSSSLQIVVKTTDFLEMVWGQEEIKGKLRSLKTTNT